MYRDTRIAYHAWAQQARMCECARANSFINTQDNNRWSEDMNFLFQNRLFLDVDVELQVCGVSQSVSQSVSEWLNE